LARDHPIKLALFTQSRKDCISHDLCARDYPAPIGMLQGWSSRPAGCRPS